MHIGLRFIDEQDDFTLLSELTEHLTETSSEFNLDELRDMIQITLKHIDRNALTQLPDTGVEISPIDEEGFLAGDDEEDEEDEDERGNGGLPPIVPNLDVIPQDILDRFADSDDDEDIFDF